MPADNGAREGRGGAMTVFLFVTAAVALVAGH